jgi:hypothetical protein
MCGSRSLLLEVAAFDREPTLKTPHGDSRRRKKRARSTNRSLRAGTAALLAVISLVHLHLWFAGYRNFNTIGPLFLVAVVSAALLAIVVLVRINRAIAVGAVMFAAGTLAANTLSLLLPDGIFRFKEVGVSYSGGFAIAAELGVVTLLSVWANKNVRIERHQLDSDHRASLPSSPFRRPAGQLENAATVSEGEKR